MNDLSRIPAYVWRLLFAAALVAVLLMTEARAGECACDVQATQPVSWIFAPSRYTHDPDNGARVSGGSYQGIPPFGYGPSFGYGYGGFPGCGYGGQFPG